MIGDSELARRWRAARPAMAGVHLDSAACSRQSNAVIDATAQHARHEAELGGYVAAEAAAATLAAGRQALGALVGMTADDVVFTTGSGHALELLLGSWSGPRTAACVPGEYGPNLAALAAAGFAVRALPVDELGRLRVDAAAAALRAEPPGLVHLTGIASHRGLVQPISEMAAVCAELGVPLILDAAQAMVQLDCAVGAAAVYSSSRKWMAGPRGIGFLAVAPELASTLVRRLPPADWDLPISALQSFTLGEVNLAAQLGYAVAVGEFLAAEPNSVRTRLAELGRAARTMLDGAGGWRVVEPRDEPTSITTLMPPGGVDPATVRGALITEHQIVSTAAEPARAPFELTVPVLRISPHLDATAEDLERFAAALLAVTARG